MIWSAFQLSIIMAIMLVLDGAWVKDTPFGPLIMVSIAVSGALCATMTINKIRGI